MTLPVIKKGMHMSEETKLPFLLEIEGTDGSGKTTAVKYVVGKLREAGLRVLETREVGSPMVPGMPDLRKIILNPELKLDGVTMEFVFAAMRFESQKFYRSVADQYDIIVSDRGWLSHLAYTEHNVSKEFVDNFYEGVVSKLTQFPDQIMYLSINQETARKRRVHRGLPVDAIEAKGEGYLTKVMATFDVLLKQFADENTWGLIQTEVEIVDANKTLEEVQVQLDGKIKNLLSTLTSEQ